MISPKFQHPDLDAFSAAVIVSIAFSFIPASFAVAIVKEHEVKAKHQQLISGVSILSYWISTYVWDFISFLFPTTCALVLFFIFEILTSTVDMRDESRGRPIQKAKIEILLGKTDNFDELMALRRRDATNGEEQS